MIVDTKVRYQNHTHHEGVSAGSMEAREVSFVRPCRDVKYMDPVRIIVVVESELVTYSGRVPPEIDVERILASIYATSAARKFEFEESKHLKITHAAAHAISENTVPVVVSFSYPSDPGSRLNV